ncbi:MAG: hypothetical protein ABSA26_14425 [Thermoguttaceae bacterium]
MKAFLMELDALYQDVVLKRWENFYRLEGGTGTGDCYPELRKPRRDTGAMSGAMEDRSSR